MIKRRNVVVVRVKEPILEVQPTNRILVDMAVDLPLRRVRAAVVSAIERSLQKEVLIFVERTKFRGDTCTRMIASTQQPLLGAMGLGDETILINRAKLEDSIIATVVEVVVSSSSVFTNCLL